MVLLFSTGLWLLSVYIIINELLTVCITSTMATQFDTNPLVFADAFIPLGVIGRGSFSEVHKVRRTQDGKIYALKRIKLPSLKPKEQQYAISEVKILAALSSPFIIGFRESFYDCEKQELCVVMEWASRHGDLQADINKRRQAMQSQIRKRSRTKEEQFLIRKKYSIPESEIWRAIRDILAGLSLLHGSSILHRDIKTANIFKSSGVYKLGDLNIAKICPGIAYAYTQTGTPYYASPQVWKELPYNTKSDIWSFGCVIYEMCELQPPFFGKDMNSLYQSVIRGRYRRINQSLYSRELIQFVDLCLKVEARERKEAHQLLSLDVVQNKFKQYKIKQQNFNQQDCQSMNNLSILESQDKQLSIKLTKQLREYRSITEPTDFQQISSNNVSHRIASSQMLNKIQQILPCSNYPNDRKNIVNKSCQKLSKKQQQSFQQSQNEGLKNKLLRPKSCKTNETENNKQKQSHHKLRRLLYSRQQQKNKDKVNMFKQLPLSQSMHENEKKDVKEVQNKQFHKFIDRGLNIKVGSGHKKSKKYILMLPLRPKPRLPGSNKSQQNKKIQNELRPHRQNSKDNMDKIQQKAHVSYLEQQKQQVIDLLKQVNNRLSNQQLKPNVNQSSVYTDLNKEPEEEVGRKYKYKYKYKFQCSGQRVRPKSQNSHRNESYVQQNQRQFHSLIKRQSRDVALESIKNIDYRTRNTPQLNPPQKLPSYPSTTKQTSQYFPTPIYPPHNHQSLNQLPRIRHILSNRNNNIRQQIGKIYYNYPQQYQKLKKKQKYQMNVLNYMKNGYSYKVI